MNIPVQSHMSTLWLHLAVQDFLFLHMLQKYRQLELSHIESMVGTKPKDRLWNSILQKFH
jgi:hypothetical protein